MGRKYTAFPAESYDSSTHNPWGNEFGSDWRSDGTPKCNTSPYGLPDFVQTKNFVASY